MEPQARFAHKMLEQLVGLGDGVQLVIKRAGERKQIVALVLQSLHRTGLPMLHRPIASDITTPAGRMMMLMIGSFGEFERAIIRGRTKQAWSLRESKVVLEGESHDPGRT